MMSPWSEWSNVFLDTFTDNGWANADPGLNEKSRVIQIVIGLSYYIREKISRKKIGTYQKLMIELNQFESFKGPSRSSGQLVFWYKNRSGGAPFSPEYKPCSICEKLGKSNLFHPERVCIK